MARIRLAIVALVVLSMGMIGTVAPAINYQHDAGDRSNGTPSGLIVELDKDKVHNGLTVKYVEFDVSREQVLCAAIIHELRKRRTDRDDKQLVQRLSGGARLLKELKTVVPLPLIPGRASEGTDPVGSMLRVKLTSVTAQGHTYAIKADLERWENRNGTPEFTWGIRQQELNLKPETWQVASSHAPGVLNPTTNKMEVQKIVLWIVYLRNDGLVDRNVRFGSLATRE